MVPCAPPGAGVAANGRRQGELGLGDRYFAILGEVDETEGVLPTDQVCARLRGALERVNGEHAPAVFAPLTVSGGFPEFAGVLLGPAPLLRIARELTETSYPMPVRVVAAYGEITGGLESRDAEGMEGPAMDKAGELLYRARKEDRMLLLATGDARFDLLFNAAALMLHRAYRGWTERQWATVRWYRELGRQAEVADRMGVTQQSVSNALSAAGWKTVAETERALEEVLSWNARVKDNEARQ